jgi:hypothetical protein
MTIEQAVLENLRDLPLDKQQEVLDFAEFLRLNTGITDEDIAEARKEMWGNFPREFPE